MLNDDELLVNSKTRHNLNRLAARPPHAVMLVGAPGSGKARLATALACAILRLPNSHELSSYPYYWHTEPHDGSIAIETVRELQKFLYLRTLGTTDIRRIVVVTDAHSLSTEAQNALLKTLEEPPTDTVIILTAPGVDSVLPTIQSRVFVVDVLPVSKAEALEYYGGRDMSASTIQQAWALARGQAGMLDSLLNQAEEHELVQAVAQAKEILSSTTFERLLRVEALAKDKPSTVQLLVALERIAQTALEHAASSNKYTQVERWHRILDVIESTIQANKRNANAKLLLTDLMLRLA